MNTIIHTIQATSRGIRFTVSDASVTTCANCKKTIARREWHSGEVWEHMHNGFSVWCFLDSPHNDSKAAPAVAA